MNDFLFFLPKPHHPQSPKKGLHLRWRLGWIKGWCVRPIWSIRRWAGGSDIRVGKRFSLQGKVEARGPGRVMIGDDCIVSGLFTPYTHDRAAMITIGSRSFINGTRLGCAIRIEIGTDAILADARILDTDFHSVHRARNTLEHKNPLRLPIRIGNNVWIAASAAILKGVQIGDDSVVAFGSVVTKSIPAGKIAAGNPAVVVSEVPS